MMVTGVQSVGAKGVGAVQAIAVDTKETTRIAAPSDADQDRAVFVKAGDPQPVVFPREGLPLDQRPVSQRMQEATARYREDGGGDDGKPIEHGHDGDREGHSADRW